jgi:hypothetical protein
MYGLEINRKNKHLYVCLDIQINLRSEILVVESIKIKFQRSLLSPCSTLKMEATGSSATLVPIHQSTWHHIPGDSNLNSRFTS